MQTRAKRVGGSYNSTHSPPIGGPVGPPGRDGPKAQVLFPGISAQNPSCLGTILGPAAHPSLGALRALQLGLRPNKIVEEGGVCAMVTASHSLCSCLQANFHPPYAHPIKLQTDLKPCCDEGYRLTGRCGHCICSHINFLEKEIDYMEGKMRSF